MSKILEKIQTLAETHDKPDLKVLEEKQVKLGLRNPDGTGVVVGLTSKGEVIGYDKTKNPVGSFLKIPVPGKLFYCGYDAVKLVEAYKKENRFGFDEVTYLLLTGKLPSKKDLEKFSKEIAKLRSLPRKEKTIIMEECAHDDHISGLHTAVSSLHKFDSSPASAEMKEVIQQCIGIIAKMPVIVAYNYQARHSKKFLKPKSRFSASENFLYLLMGKRPDKEDALILDAVMTLLAEHGGGNNSTFAVRVVTSSGANSYMAISSGIASLSGYLHGGAAEGVAMMMSSLKKNVKDWEDDREIEAYLLSLLKNRASKFGGKIYGMGHAVYTISDPRVEVLEAFAEKLAKKNKREKEFLLYKSVARIAPQVILKEKKIQTCPNVDFFTGFVYDNLKIPQELFTPIFAMSRVSGWCAHRIEEIIQGKLIRPAYVTPHKQEKEYVPPEARK